MKDKIIFGPAGKPLDYKGSAYTASSYLNEHGLHAFEYQSSHGIRIGEKSAKILKKQSEEENVLISMHAPYYINMCSKEDEKIDASIERLVDSARVGEWMGAYRLVFHPGFYSNQKPEKALEIAKKGYKKLINRCEEEGFENYTFAPETTGKRSQLGNIDEIISMCQDFDHFEPTIDFAHIHARGGGILNKKEDYNCIFSKLENGLDIQHLHCHFTTIEYSYNGEKKHHNLEDSSDYGPYIEDLLSNLIDNGWNATIICETPLRDKDSMKMKEIYESLI
jgi:deoxyribonuclease-4